MPKLNISLNEKKNILIITKDEEVSYVIIKNITSITFDGRHLEICLGADKKEFLITSSEKDIATMRSMHTDLIKHVQENL